MAVAGAIAAGTMAVVDASPAGSGISGDRAGALRALVGHGLEHLVERNPSLAESNGL